MNTTIDVLGKKLLALMGDVHFRSDYDKALNSPEQLIAIGEHNLREYEKIEVMSEERQERIRNLIANILASGFQKEAIEKYGNTNSSSIRQVLRDWFKQPNTQSYWNKLMRTAKESLLSFHLTEDQCEAVIKYLHDGLYDRLPEALIECVEELCRPSRLFPRTEAPSIASAIADIMKEANYAHG